MAFIRVWKSNPEKSENITKISYFLIYCSDYLATWSFKFQRHVCLIVRLASDFSRYIFFMAFRASAVLPNEFKRLMFKLINSLSRNIKPPSCPFQTPDKVRSTTISTFHPSIHFPYPRNRQASGPWPELTVLNAPKKITGISKPFMNESTFPNKKKCIIV